MENRISSHLERVFENYPDLTFLKGTILSVFSSMVSSLQNGGKILVCGNGGSAADTEHIVGELMKGYLLKRTIPDDLSRKISAVSPLKGDYISSRLQGALPAISLVSQVSLSTAISNDLDSDMVFAQQVYGYGKSGDVLLAISTSGNAENVCNAAITARAMDVLVIGLTGADGGKLKNLCNLSVCVPAKETWRVQEFHQPIYHSLCAMLEENFFTVK